MRLTLSSDDTVEFGYCLTHAKHFADQLQSSTLSRYDVEVIYRWISAVGYYLPISQFSSSQCGQTQRPFYNILLPKMGFNQHYARIVIFGPYKYQGKHMVDYEVEQYTKHLAIFVSCLRQDRKIGNLLWIQTDQH